MGKRQAVLRLKYNKPHLHGKNILDFPASESAVLINKKFDWYGLTMPIFQRHHFARLLTLAEKGRIAPLYLFQGDLGVARELVRKLAKALVSQGALIEEYDLAEEDLQKIKLSLTSPALLGRKVVVAGGPQEKLTEEVSQEIVSLLEIGKQNQTLILSVEEIETNHPLYRYAEKQGVIVPLKKVRRPKDLVQYELPDLLAELGKKMDRLTAELLLEMVGDDPAALRQEVEKLALYVGEAPVITKEDVLTLVSARPEQAPYTLIEALFTHGPDQALKLLRDLVEQGIPYLVLVATLATFFKRLWLLKYMISQEESLRLTRDYQAFRQGLETAKKTLWGERPPRVLANLHPYALFRLRRYAETLSEEKIKNLLLELALMDEALKSRPVSPEDLFYAFFLKARGIDSKKALWA